MKSKKVFLTLIFMFMMTPIVHADMIEVKGKGFISGTMISESSAEVIFKDSYGQTQHFPRSVVTYIEKDKKSAGTHKRFEFPSGQGLLGGLLTGGQPKKESTGRSDWIDKNADLTDQIISGVNGLSQTVLDFFFRGQDISALSKTAQAKVTGFKDYRSKDLMLGGVGMAIMFLGAIAFVIFGFRLIADAFERHFLWGVAFLAIPLSYLAPIVGGSFGLFAMVPYFASLCFVIVHWRVARVAFVAQLFASNFILLGFFILQAAS